MSDKIIGRTIQLFLVDDNPAGLIIASIHGWTGSVLVSTQSTFKHLLERPELNRTGLYILYGPDPDDDLKTRAYIGEADSVQERIIASARKRKFWVSAAIITTSDEALTKGHVRYLEARLIEIAKQAGRVTLDNAQMPDADKRRLPEADRANMEAFIRNLTVILPVIGLDLLKQRVPGTPALQLVEAVRPQSSVEGTVRFKLKHKSGIAAFGYDFNGEFVVEKGSETLKDAGYKTNSYGRLKDDLIKDCILQPTADGQRYVFAEAYGFNSPSAAGSVILDRNTNGRVRWRMIDTGISYHEWQTGDQSVEMLDQETE